MVEIFPGTGGAINFLESANAEKEFSRQHGVARNIYI
jgi:hypothetical protein